MKEQRSFLFLDTRLGIESFSVTISEITLKFENSNQESTLCEIKRKDIDALLVD